jgi:hypothetical protein
MKITAQRRLAGMLLLALLTVAVFVPAALAANVTGSGAGGGIATAGTAGRGGISPPLAAAAQAAAESTASSFSTTTWIVIGVAAALAVGIVAWVLISRRPRLTASTERYCALHPSDTLCGAA